MARSSQLTVIADTGALYALIDRSDAWHDRVREWWEVGSARVLVPHTVLPEIAYLLGSRIGAKAEVAFAESVASGQFQLEGLVAKDFPVIAGLTKQYHDLPLDFTDASLLAVASRIGTRALLTTDRRHFSVARLPDGSKPILYP